MKRRLLVFIALACVIVLGLAGLKTFLQYKHEVKTYTAFTIAADDADTLYEIQYLVEVFGDLDDRFRIPIAEAAERFVEDLPEPMDTRQARILIEGLMNVRHLLSDDLFNRRLQELSIDGIYNNLRALVRIGHYSEFNKLVTAYGSISEDVEVSPYTAQVRQKVDSLIAEYTDSHQNSTVVSEMDMWTLLPQYGIADGDPWVDRYNSLVLEIIDQGVPSTMFYFIWTKYLKDIHLGNDVIENLRFALADAIIAEVEMTYMYGTMNRLQKLKELYQNAIKDMLPDSARMEVANLISAADILFDKLAVAGGST